MADAVSTTKRTVRKIKQDQLTSRSFLHCGNTPLATSSRLSLLSNEKLAKGASSSLEKLSFISEKEDSHELHLYHLEYSTYLLRKIQNRLLAQSMEQKQENVKRCLASLKMEYEGLIERYVKLSKEIGYLKIFFEILRESDRRIEEGNKILKVLKENKFEEFLKSLSSSLDHRINQLQLVGVDKQSVEELFRNNVWGCGSELEECLKKTDNFISKNKDEVSNIAAELVEVKKLSLENALLRERFSLAYGKFSSEFLETNYKLFTGIVKRAFIERQECEDGATVNNLNCNLAEFLQSAVKPGNEQFTFQLSNLDCSYPVTPNSASTPQHE